MSELAIKNLTKIFEIKGHTVTALSDVSLSIEKGDIFGIIGMSGAGKSTLVRTVNYLEKPTQGSILIDGVNLSTLSEKELRKKRREIGMISRTLIFWSRRMSSTTYAFLWKLQVPKERKPG